MLSVIIPTLNESNSLSDALQALFATMGKDAEFEIILCDGGSRDDSLEQADHFPVTILNTSRGRAQQMNAGARQARGEWLVFLHVDTRLPDSWMSDINNCGSAWGRFDVRLSGTHWLFRVIEQAMNYRSRITAVATGDQVLFFRRDFFWHIGGYPDIPLMEDIAISKSARSHERPACLPQRVITSSRRWERKGIIRTMLLMWSLRLAYWLGVKPETLHRLYYPENPAA